MNTRLIKVGYSKAKHQHAACQRARAFAVTLLNSNNFIKLFFQLLCLEAGNCLAFEAWNNVVCVFHVWRRLGLIESQMAFVHGFLNTMHR